MVDSTWNKVPCECVASVQIWGSDLPTVAYKRGSFKKVKTSCHETLWKTDRTNT